jgi:voltage-gated potassium channel
VLASLLRWSCDYGQSLGLWGLWVLGAILFLYAILPAMISGHGLFDAVYFSVTTFATLGLGDIVPISNLGKLVVMVEVTTGYLMGGLLIAILVRRLIGN